MPNARKISWRIDDGMDPRHATDSLTDFYGQRRPVERRPRFKLLFKTDAVPKTSTVRQIFKNDPLSFYGAKYSSRPGERKNQPLLGIEPRIS